MQEILNGISLFFGSQYVNFVVVISALCLLMLAAYRGHSIILVAPLIAILAILFTTPLNAFPLFTSVFMGKMVGFVQSYFPVFLLGAIFGKLIELSGYSQAIVAAVIRWVGKERAILVIVTVCALLTYGGVSLFVVVFAVYPFAAELFRQNNIPKRLIPGAVALGAFSFTMDALPGTPQIQNIIPTRVFGTTAYAAPILGIAGSIFILIVGLTYLNWRMKSLTKAGKGYADGPLVNEPEPVDTSVLPSPILAIAPLIIIGVLNFAFTQLIPIIYGEETYNVNFSGLPSPIAVSIKDVQGIWAVEGALVCGIFFILFTAWKTVKNKFVDGSKTAVGGAMLAGLNTASEYGFGAVIAMLPGFFLVRDALSYVPDPLINAAVSVTSLAGVTGSASGGMTIALGALGDHFVAACEAAGISLEVLHRVVSMASGGMDTLPHNGAVITVLAVTGLTHREAYKDIFAVTIIKSLAVLFIIGLFYATGFV